MGKSGAVPDSEFDFSYVILMHTDKEARAFSISCFCECAYNKLCIFIMNCVCLMYRVSHYPKYTKTYSFILPDNSVMVNFGVF